MLEFEIEIDPHLTGELASRIMALWPGQEVKTSKRTVTLLLPMDDEIDHNLRRFEQVLTALENARNLPLLTVHGRNLDGPDSGPGRISVGRFLILKVGAEARPEPDQILLTLDAGLAFGTGGHPSTALALVAIEDYFNHPPGYPSRSAARILDLGTGSGILALAAARLGTGPILAVDTAFEAVEATRKNADLNGLTSRLEISQTSADKITGRFDLILANLIPAVLIKLGKNMAGLLDPGGTVIAAGFADQQTPQVVKAMTKAGLIVSKSYSRAGWSALCLTKPA